LSRANVGGREGRLRYRLKLQIPSSSETPSTKPQEEITFAIVWFLKFLWCLFACGRIRPAAEMLELGAFERTALESIGRTQSDFRLRLRKERGMRSPSRRRQASMPCGSGSQLYEYREVE
jgi:hypothetical protein